MEISQGYERVIPKRNTKRRVAGIAVYAVFGIAAVLLTLFTMNIYIAVLSVFAEVILILLTRKYLSIELEYSFIGGVFTASRIYGKSTRRVICECELSDCIYIAHATPDNTARAASMRPERVYDLTGDGVDEAQLIIVIEEDKVRTQLLINADKRTLSVLYKANPSVCSLEVRVQAR